MISVSILSKKDNYLKTIEKINETNADYLHLDIMDGTFTPFKSFTYDQIKEICKINNKKLDIHLMSKDLENQIDKCMDLNPEIISIHFEAINKIDKYIEKIKNKNILVGLAINPTTDISKIYDYLNKVDIVLVMGVIPGEAGQQYIKSTTEKLIQLKKLQPDYKYKVEVDGGINSDIINEVKKYTDIIVSGSFITNSDNYQKKINELNM